MSFLLLKREILFKLQAQFATAAKVPPQANPFLMLIFFASPLFRLFFRRPEKKKKGPKIALLCLQA